jgi:hypothetical protein
MIVIVIALAVIFTSITVSGILEGVSLAFGTTPFSTTYVSLIRWTGLYMVNCFKSVLEGILSFTPLEWTVFLGMWAIIIYVIAKKLAKMVAKEKEKDLERAWVVLSDSIASAIDEK